MSDNKRYYWLKLKANFFEEKTTKFLRKLPDGDKLVITYLKMQLKSLTTAGVLQYDRLLPSCEEELALILDEDINIVKFTIKALLQCNAIEILDDNSIYLIAMKDLIGNESTSAERVRRFRENQKLALQCNTNVQKCNTELEIEKELEKELEKFSAKLKTKIKEWLKYKSERNEGYKSTGLKNLLLEIKERSKELSEDDIEYVINLSMSNGWKGIIWSEIKRKYSNNQYVNKTQNEFNDLERFYTT
jgi:predicted phage replisome organizer